MLAFFALLCFSSPVESDKEFRSDGFGQTHTHNDTMMLLFMLSLLLLLVYCSVVLLNPFLLLDYHLVVAVHSFLLD